MSLSSVSRLLRDSDYIKLVECQRSFNLIKATVTKYHDVLSYFEPKINTIIQYDASMNGFALIKMKTINAFRVPTRAVQCQTNVERELLEAL